MSRIIKFRAWGPNCKVMWSWEEVQGIANQLGWENFTEGERELLQYTEFNSGDGTEIYDGDIVQFFDDERFEVYRESSGAWGLKGMGDSLEDHAVQLCVIGNIYQNADLLK